MLLFKSSIVFICSLIGLVSVYGEAVADSGTEIARPGNEYIHPDNGAATASLHSTGTLATGTLATDTPAAEDAPAAPENAIVSPKSDAHEDIRWVGMWESAKLLWLESAGTLGLITFTGFRDWKWGTASFRFNSEGWFGMDTGSGGMDKLGHIYGGYVFSELLQWRLHAHCEQRRCPSFYPAAYSMFLMLYTELFDGFSVDHGWSWEDVVMDTIGASMSLARSISPRFASLVDFRFQFWPSKGAKGFHPIIDYEGQKYMLVFKAAGIKPLLQTPFRFLELMIGYYARGFLASNTTDTHRKATLFFGVGLSLEQLFFVPLEKHVSPNFSVFKYAFHYFQLPYTYEPFTINERRRRRPNMNPLVNTPPPPGGPVGFWAGRSTR